MDSVWSLIELESAFKMNKVVLETQTKFRRMIVLKCSVHFIISSLSLLDGNMIVVNTVHLENEWPDFGTIIMRYRVEIVGHVAF